MANQSDNQRLDLEQDEEAKLRDFQRALSEYISTETIRERFRDLLDQGKTRFPINLDDLRREKGEDLVSYLIKQPVKLLADMLINIKTEVVQLADPDAKQSTMFKPIEYKISFEGNLGRNHVTPRGLSAQLVNNLVAVSGIVTRMSLVQPKLLTSVHYVEANNQRIPREYTDNHDPSKNTELNYTTVVPRKDAEGNPMMMEYGLSQFRDCQKIMIQELPERTPTGLLPRSVEIILEDDLVDLAKPGDRVKIVGIFKCFAGMGTSGDGSFRSALLGLSVNQMNAENDEMNISLEDIKLIEQIAQKQNILDYISKSIAPSIYGHENIKKAVLLMLLGGTEKNLSTGTHLRGDINMLLIGDPSTAKSQMLRYIMTIAPLSITTTGRGSSSVGLTAAVRRDQESGENVLEAGAMVLADGGVVLIDEFDKMNEADRVAIHEVMEQQTVTIAKAGIHCSLNARCSVVAAANPIYGEYQKDLPPTKNIGLPDSLLSRFDLLFIVLDEKQEAIDRRVAERVTKNHRYRGPGDNQGQTGLQDSFIITQAFKLKQEQGPYVSYQSNLYSSEQKDLLSQTFLKKYISYAKKLITQTVLENDSIDMITLEWVQMRQQDLTAKNLKYRILPITIRSLESLIRLASAHAKLRLSTKVTVEDCQVAIQLMRFTLWEGDQTHENDDYSGGQDNNNDDDDDRKPPKAQKIEIEQPKKKESISKKKEPKTDVIKEMKKLKIDDDEVDKNINFQKLDKVQLTERDKNLVFKALVNNKNKTGEDTITTDALWILVQQNGVIKDEQVFLKALVELDIKVKIILDSKKKTVQLL